MDERALGGILGLAMKAGQLVKGAEKSVLLVRDKKAAMVLLDGNASENTQKRVQDTCRHYNVPLTIQKPGLLAQACGQAEMAAAAIKPGHLADRLRLITLDEQNPNPNESKIAEDVG